MNGPSAFYRQHREIEAPRIDDRHFRVHFRVVTKLDGLLADRLITGAEWHAAADFRELVELARADKSYSPLSATGGGGDRSLPAALVAALDAHARLAPIQAALGRPHFRLLVASVVDNATWIALGNLYRIDHRTARKRVADAIKALARLDIA